ncbi:4Fe-4S binding protein, partial [Enterococcus faecium]
MQDKDKCINCGKCKKVCQMNKDSVENCNHL